MCVGCFYFRGEVSYWKVLTDVRVWQNRTDDGDRTGPYDDDEYYYYYSRCAYDDYDYYYDADGARYYYVSL